MKWLKNYWAGKSVRQRIYLCIVMVLLLTFLFFVVKGNTFDKLVPTSQQTREAYITLYREMCENGEFAENLYAEISDMLYADHTDIDKGRQKAHELGLPYDEYPYDPEENFDPYAYNPNRMSDEDYDRMHDLIDKERAEAENLKGREVRIDDRAYYIEDIIWYSDRPEAKLRAVYDSLDPIKYEYLDVVSSILEQQDRQTIEDSIELKIPYTENSLLHSFLDEHYPDKNPPFPYLERGSKLSAEEQEILDKFKAQYPIKLKENLHRSAFEKLKANHDFRPETIELLDRVEQQMSINNILHSICKCSNYLYFSRNTVCCREYPKRCLMAD